MWAMQQDRKDVSDREIVTASILLVRKHNPLHDHRRLALAVLVFLAGLCGSSTAQESPNADAASQVTTATTTNAPLTITFSDALKRAEANNPALQAAYTTAGVAHQDVVQSRAALLPNVTYNMLYLYTQPTRNPNQSFIFIANNSVNEYVAQGNVHQSLSLQDFASYQRAEAAQAMARAKSEIARRGLAVTVAQSYYGYIASQRKYATEQRASEEAQRFMDISEKLEKGGEVAHSDVVKARIQYRQQQRDLREAELGMNRARLDLSVLLFPDFTENFSVVEDTGTPEALPSFEEVTAAAAKNNPDMRAAQAALLQARRETMGAWGGILPSFGLDYWYGIDATHLATRTDGFNNLGSSAAVSLQLPIWNWGANISKLKQANVQKKQAVVELSAAQRTLLAKIHEFYDEGSAARDELELLASSAQMAADSLRLINMRYRGGEATVLEVVDAQNTLTAVANAYNDGQVRMKVAVANLQTLTGKF
jgi:outer membrane protein TolC